MEKFFLNTEKISGKKKCCTFFQSPYVGKKYISVEFSEMKKRKSFHFHFFKLFHFHVFWKSTGGKRFIKRSIYGSFMWYLLNKEV